VRSSLGGPGVTEWFDVSTLKEPYRIEGKKTMGLELAEQLGSIRQGVYWPDRYVESLC
jgi:threonine synthase